MRFRVMVVVFALSLTPLLTGCSGAENACAAPTISLSPAPVVAGADVTVVVAGAYAELQRPR